MIDLNHLLKNIDLYKERYSHKGLKTNVDYFLQAENKRKELQLKTEKMRALCNKLCAEVPLFREKNKDTTELISQITILDEQIKRNNKQLEKYHKQINKNLKKLHTLPEFLNQYNEQMPTTNNNVMLSDLCDVINKNYNVSNFNGKILSFFKQKQDVLFQESSMPCVINCKDGYLFLCEEADVDKIKKFFLDYFSNNALSLIKVSCRKLNKENESSFYVHLNKKESFYFEINKEFYTRQFNIKYKNSKIDMTKFVNQINVLLKW